MDALGGNGNGYRWFASEDAPLTLSPLYTKWSQQRIASIDATDLKTDITESYGSVQAAPVLNYLVWLLQIVKEVA